MSNTHKIAASQMTRNTATKRRSGATQRDNTATTIAPLARLAHEIRSPLHVIVNAAHILQGHAVTQTPLVAANDTRWVDLILRNSEHLNRLIDQVLDAANLATEHLTLAPHIIDVGVSITAAIAQIAPLAEERQQPLVTTIAPDLPLIAADPDRLTQIVINLLTNAIKFTPSGGTITVGVQRGPDATVEIFVRDSGPGIAKKHHKAIFEPFVQMPSHDTQPHDGIGLGLSVVRELVQLHHGTVWVESVWRKGSTFWVRLPISPNV